MKEKKYTGANWNIKDDNFTQEFWAQNLSQFWRAEDISLQPDLNVWLTLPQEVKDAYAQNLLVLTFLDTYQGDIGMPVVARSLDDEEHQRKAVLNFMAAMENAVHAKSYSNIFMTYMPSKETNELFVWGEKNQNLQNIVSIIVGYYKALDIANHERKYGTNYDAQTFKETQWKAMVASVFLETWLFYSGFYYPLWFYGQGKLMQAGEIINLILRDESIHGLYVGKLAQEIYDNFSEDKQKELFGWLKELLNRLYEQQLKITETIYNPVGLTEDVKVFLRYNANKALMNLGFEPYFPYEEVNPVVLNGLNTETKTMDNFSMKGNGYQKMKSEAVADEDFIFNTKVLGKLKP
jgi:ribonucleoside-diphosphate reductase beta chain